MPLPDIIPTDELKYMPVPPHPLPILPIHRLLIDKLTVCLLATFNERGFKCESKICTQNQTATEWLASGSELTDYEVPELVSVSVGRSNDAHHVTDLVILHEAQWSREVGHEVRNARRG